MSWIKDKLYNQRLRKSITNITSITKEQFKNNGDQIAVLFEETTDFSAADVYKQVLSWRKLGKNIFLFSFLDEKELLEEENENRFFKSDLNWLSIPNGKKIDDFLQKSFDILITINPERKKHLHYLNAVSKARFKIGILPDEVEFYNLIIDCDKPDSVKVVFSDIQLTLDKLAL